MRTYHRYGSYFEPVTYWREMFFFFERPAFAVSLGLGSLLAGWLAGWLAGFNGD